MKCVNYIVTICVICFSFSAFAQQDTIPPTPLDSTFQRQKTNITNDTIPETFSEKADSIPSTDVPNGFGTRPVATFPIADNAIDSELNYGARDSSRTDLKSNQIHLFGEAFIKYKDYDLKAGYIIFDFNKNEASAFTIKDATGTEIGKPVFTDGNSTFNSTGLKYNFKTNKGLIYNARTQEGEFNVLGERTKFISMADDSTAMGDELYNKNAQITTCNAPTPHFAIRSTKLKLIPDKLAIAGLSNLEIYGIPTPVVLPFAFFPMVQGRSNGLIFPNNFDYRDDLGLGILGLGYYFPVNDYMDVKVLTDFYTRGTHRVNVRTNYKKRYQYSGDVSLSYSNDITESLVDGSNLSNIALSLVVNHRQDTKAHPYRKLDGSINLKTNRFDQQVSNEFEDQVNNKITSNFSYRHEMPGTPFRFTAGFQHNQDTRTRQVNITLPNATLRMQTIYPFKDENGKKDWYDAINLAYDAEFKNYLRATDSTLFTSQALENLQTGLQHDATLGTNFTLLKYLNGSATLRGEQWLFARTLEKRLDPTITIDTTGTQLDQNGDTLYLTRQNFGEVVDEFQTGFAMLNKYNFSTNLSTNLFFTKKLKKGLIRGFRHTMKPRVGFTYAPSTEDELLTVMANSDPDSDELIEYNPYIGAFTPSLTGEQMSLTYGIDNLFEGKYYSKKDSTEKKFKFLNRLGVSGNYNFARDSLKASPLAIRGNSTFFKGITSINFSATYNFYVKEDGVLVNRTVWEDRKRPVEFDRFNLNVTNNFSVKRIKELFKKKKSNNQPAAAREDSSGKKTTQSFQEFFDNFTISHSYTFQRRREASGRDTSIVTNHSIRLRGNLDLSENWTVSIENISYDLINKKFVYPSFSFTRKLHCWDMRFSWRPQRGNYSFFIGVSSGTFSFLKYNYGENIGNGIGFPR